MSQPENNNSGPGKNLDNLFRDAIGRQEFKPSPGVWKNLSWKLLIRELAHFNFTNVPRLALVTASGGLIVVASLTFWALYDGSEPPRLNSSATALPAAEAPAPQTTPAVPQQNAAEIKATVTQNSSISGNSASSSHLVPVKSAVAEVPAHRQPALIASNTHINSKTAVSEPTAASEAGSSSLNSSERMPSGSIGSIEALAFSNFDILPADDTMSIVRAGEVYKYVREPAPVPSFFSADLGIAPEMALYNNAGSSRQEFNYWANAGIAYHYSRFSIRTGIGYGVTYDEGVYKVEYRSNDSVSFFREVVGYYPDPKNPSNIIYITRNHVIYDSVTHIADDRTRNRYSYLQVPLLIGYNVLETPRFNLGFEAGPAVAFLIGEKAAQPVIDIPNGRLVKLENSTPARVSTNWQLWVKLSIGYQFTKNWGFVINPYYKYYLTTPAHSDETGSVNTQAFGVDVGIRYLFGRKSNKK